MKIVVISGMIALGIFAQVAMEYDIPGWPILCGLGIIILQVVLVALWYAENEPPDTDALSRAYEAIADLEKQVAESNAKQEDKKAAQ